MSSNINNGRRQSLSERLANLRDTKSYMYLGRRGVNNQNGTATNTTGGSSSHRKTKRTSSNFVRSSNNTKSNLTRDELLIFELVVHSRDDENDGDGSSGDGIHKQTSQKSTIRDSSDYSVVYHNWTLRQLYRHVVSSVKVVSSSSAAGGAATVPTAAPTPGSKAVRVGKEGSRKKSVSMSGDIFAPLDRSNEVAFASPPPPNPFHPRRPRSASVTSQPQRSYGSLANNNHNITTNARFHPPQNPSKLLGSNLHPRDMRRLVTPFSASNEPELIVRRHVMVFNFDPLRAIITRDRLLVLVPNGADSILKNLEEKIVGNSLEYAEYEDFEDEEVPKAPSDSTHNRDETSTSNYSTGGDVLGPLLTDKVGRLSANSISICSMENGMFSDGIFSDHESDTIENDSEMDEDENKEDHVDMGEEVDSDDDNWSEIMMEMERMEMEDHRDLTFELMCVNACLSSVFEMLADDTNELQDKGLAYVQDRIIGDRRRGAGRNRGVATKKKHLRPEDALAILRNLKNATKIMQARVKGFVQSIQRILNEDEDMALMNLSRLVTHPENFLQPASPELLEIESDEPELVLESNLNNALTLSNALDLIQGQVDTASDLIDARMDAARNKFLLASLVMSIASLSLTAMTCVGGIFGMNLTSGLENDEGDTSNDTFLQVTFGSIIGSMVLAIAIFAIMILTGVITGLGPVDQEGIDSLF